MNTSLISATYTWAQFAPVYSLVGLAVLILLADAFLPRISKQIYPLIAAVGTFIAACFMIKGEYASSFGLLACGATTVCLIMLWDYRATVYASVAGGDDAEGSSELAVLPLIATAGVCALTQARDLIMLFVCLETVTLASYAMAGFFRRNQGSVEAGVKYLILGAVSTGILVMGAAWYFGTTGTFFLNAQMELAALSNTHLCTGFLLGLGMLLAGAFFKVGAAPMHTWIPDVYQGAPTPVSAYLAVVSKVAGFIVLLLFTIPLMQIGQQLPNIIAPIIYTLGVVAALTLLIGNLGAINQVNIKRLMGYSSIGQAGFILIFFVGMRNNFASEVCYYLLAYGVATLAVFYAITQLRQQRGSEEIDAFNGLGKTNPRTASLITVCFASLAGVPLTGGFLAKWSSFRAMIYGLQRWEHLSWSLLIIMIICATAGFYYYFKVLRAMYWEKPESHATPVAFTPGALVILSLSALILIGMGTLPLIIS